MTRPRTPCISLRYWHSNGSVGTIGGINKALYPGRLSTPTLNFNNTGSVTPATAARIEVLLSRAMGDEYDQTEDSFYYMNPAQGYGLSQDYWNRAISTTDMGKGVEEIPDTAKRQLQTSFGGIETHYSNSALPTRIDRVFPAEWVVGELMETRLHEWTPGNVIAPVPVSNVASATYYNSIMFAYETGLQLVNRNPKKAFYAQNCPLVSIS